MLFGTTADVRSWRKAAIELYSKRISLALVRWSYPKLLTKDRTEKAIHYVSEDIAASESM